MNHLPVLIRGKLLNWVIVLNQRSLSRLGSLLCRSLTVVVADRRLNVLPVDYLRTKNTFLLFLILEDLTIVCLTLVFLQFHFFFKAFNDCSAFFNYALLLELFKVVLLLL